MREIPAPVAVVTLTAGGQSAGLPSTRSSRFARAPARRTSLSGGTPRPRAAARLAAPPSAFWPPVKSILAQHFARGVPPIGLWTGIETRDGELGAPLIEGAIGWIECRLGSSIRPGTTPSSWARSSRPTAARAAKRCSIFAGSTRDRGRRFRSRRILLDTEELWNEARRQITDERGGRWRDDAQQAMMGMSSPEYPGTCTTCSACRIRRRRSRRRSWDGSRLCTVSGCRRSGTWRPCGESVNGAPRIASSSNRPLIDLFLELTGTGELPHHGLLEEVERGKPAPDVYLEAARRLGVPPEGCAAIEDSENGICSAAAAGMRVSRSRNHVSRRATRLFPRQSRPRLAGRVHPEVIEEL